MLYRLSYASRKPTIILIGRQIARQIYSCKYFIGFTGVSLTITS